jgi:hypothetical protein
MVQVLDSVPGSGCRQDAFGVLFSPANPNQPIAARSDQDVAGFGQEPLRISLMHDELIDLPNRPKNFIKMLDLPLCLPACSDVPDDGEDPTLAADVGTPQSDLAPEQLAVLPLALPFEDLRAFCSRLPDPTNGFLMGERPAGTQFIAVQV